MMPTRKMHSTVGLRHGEFAAAQPRANVRVRAALICDWLHSRQHLHRLDGKIYQLTLIAIILHIDEHTCLW